VDVTPDGMTIICGAPGGWVRPGYVRVLSLEGDSKQIGQDIIGEANGDEFGSSVSISGDGKTIAVGAPSNDGINGVDSGHVRIYRLMDEQDIDGEAAWDYSGSSLSLSADGSTVAIGAPRSGNDSGSGGSGQVTVYRFDGEGSSWERLGQSMHGNNFFDSLGYSVKLSPDGNTLAIGSPGGSVGGDILG
jgi:hypothetical protein